MNPRKPSSKKSKESKEEAEKPQVMKRRAISKNTEDNERVKPKRIKTISTKKVLFTDLDDEITSLYDKLKKYKIKNIYIVVPKRALIFQSIVNLRILKRKAQDLDKNIYIITNDHNGIKLAQRAGIAVFDKLESDEHPSLVSGKLKEESLKIMPLEASINTYEDETPTRMKTKKLSITELLQKTRKSVSKKISKGKKKKGRPKKESKHKYVFASPNRQAIVLLVTISVLILVIITYVALPGATIVLTPRSNIIEQSANVTLADVSQNAAYLETRPVNVISSNKMEVTLNETTTYYVTGEQFEGKNSTGNITILNTTNKGWPLVTNTRFQTEEGLVFRIQQAVTVPAASLTEPGKLDVFVVADETDAVDRIIGEKGNIGATTFFLPGLSETNQAKLYAESYDSFSGGETITKKIVIAEDLEAARVRMEDHLREQANQGLQNEIATKNASEGLSLQLLEGHAAVNIGDPSVTIPEGLEGQLIESFEVSGSITATGTSFNYDELVQILRDKLKFSKSPEKALVKIDLESVTYRLLPLEDGQDSSRRTVTATIKGIEQFDIDPEIENGRRLIENITDHILGVSVDEAENYIQQLPSINKVEIKTWPAWSPNIPSVPDNIKIKIDDGL